MSSGLGIDFGHESEAYFTDTGSRTSTSTSGFHSRTRAHMIPKKSSMNKLRGQRPKTAEEDARRVRIVSGEPSVLGHGAYTDEDFMSEDEKVQPHQLHSLAAAVAAMGGYSTDTATSSTETDSDQSPTFTESSVTSASSAASGTLKKSSSQPQLKDAKAVKAATPAATRSRPTSEMISTAGGRLVRESKSNTSLASGYRSDGGSSLGRSAEIPRGVGRHRVSIRGAASRQATLQKRLGPEIHSNSASTSRQTRDNAAIAAQEPEAVSGDETEVMVPDGFGGHTRVKQPRSQPATVPALLQRIDVTSQHSRTTSEPARSHADTSKWRVGSFYGPDGSETARIDLQTGTISEVASQTPGSDADPIPRLTSYSTFDGTSVYLSRSQTSSHGPKANLMRSPSNQANNSADVAAQDDVVEGSTKAAALEQNRLSRTSTARVSMRSKRGLQGLEGAELGGALVSLDKYQMTYDTGMSVLPHEITALDQDSLMGSVRLGSTTQQMRMSVSHSGTQQSSSSSTTQRQTSSPSKAADSQVGTPNGVSKLKNRPRRSLSDTNVHPSLLERHGTLLSTTANPLRRNKELNRLLGNSDRKLPASAAKPSVPTVDSGLKRSNAVSSTTAPPPAALEQGKANKARVEVDLVLESDLAVEGGTLQGRMQIHVRKGSQKEGVVFLAQPKIRVVGFEELLADDTRHIFYHHASVIDGDRSSGGPSEPYYLDGSPTLSSPETGAFTALACFNGGPDKEGYAEGKLGSHSIPFSLELPVSKGAKGSYRGKSAVVRYIVIGSVKLKSASGANRSIAHFYRHIDLFPYLNPAVVLSNSLKPIQATSSKGLFLGGSGKVHLMASLHRNTWVAGQRVYINISVQNDTSKKINGMTLALIRTVTLYKPRPELDLNELARRNELDPDACQTSTTRKKIAEEELEMGQKGSRGVVTAKGWWTGVEPGQKVDSSHYMQIPADALSISRGRHVEVVYSIKVSIGSSLSSDVSVELPLRVINFVSLDPPPRKKAGNVDTARSWGAPSEAKSPADQMVARLKSVDAMRSPGKTEISLHNHDQHLQVAKMLSPGEVEAEQSKRLQHQKSLDFINHAIRSAAARRGVDVTPTLSSSARTPSPTGLGLGIGIGPLDSISETSKPSPGGSSSTDGNSGADEDFAEEEDDNTKTPMASNRRSGPSPLVYPPGCEPYEPHHHQAALQAQGTYSHMPVPLHLPGGMHHMQQMQMQMYQLSNASHAQRSNPMLPMLRINNANAVSLDEVGDDYDDEDQEDHGDRTLGLNDESMDEMNLVIGSARLDDDEEYGQLDDSLYGVDVLPVLEEGKEQIAGEEDLQPEGWSLRRRGSGEDDNEATDQARKEKDEADDVAEVSSIMQAVSIAAPVATGALPPSSTSAPSSILPPTAGVRKVSNLSPKAPAFIPMRGDSRPLPESTLNVTGPLKISKDATTLLPQQVIRATSSELPAERTTTIPLSNQALSAANLKRHSDNLTYRHQQQVQHNRHRSTHSVTRLKPLLLQPKASKERCGSTVGSRTPETASPSNDASSSEGIKTPESVSDELPQQAVDKTSEVTTDSAPASISLVKSSSDMPRSSTLRTMPTAAPPGRLRHSDSTSSLLSETSTETATTGALSRSHSTHNLGGAAVMVPSVRNKIAMLESRASALREFTGAAVSSSPTPSPMKASSSSGRVAQLAERAERASSLTPSTSGQFRLARKGSSVSMAESEDDGAASVVSSVVTVPEYMKTASKGVSSFNAPMLRSLR